MVQTREGVFAPTQTKVVVLWDLDNKPPRGPPYDAAVSLKTLAARFGEVVDISAYANRHAFSHLPARVLEERRARRQMDSLERKDPVTRRPTRVYNRRARSPREEDQEQAEPGNLEEAELGETDKEEEDKEAGNSEEEDKADLE